MISKLAKLLIATAVLVAGLCISYIAFSVVVEYDSIRVGVLHSQTGVFAISELPVVDATLLAIDEINKQGGLLGKIIEPIIVDGASDPATFASAAEKLILERKVDALFGCWASSSRKAVLSVVEKYDNLLFYPVQYEGIESSRNIIYNGSTPNQQILPALTWCIQHLGTRFFLVGSDYVFPRTANKIMRNYLAFFDVNIVGEEYISLKAGYDQYEKMVAAIKQAQPTVIINTINGSGNAAFFRALRDAGITPETIPTMSFSIGEEELSFIGTELLVGDYATWAYFQSIENKINTEFIQKFKKRYGNHRVVSDPLESAYFGVKLWAKAVQKAGSSDPGVVQPAVLGSGGTVPEGIVFIDPDNNNAWKMVRIGKIRSDGQFDILWTSQRSMRPLTYPLLYQKENWETFLEKLYEGWNQKWVSED